MRWLARASRPSDAARLRRLEGPGRRRPGLSFASCTPRLSTPAGGPSHGTHEGERLRSADPRDLRRLRARQDLEARVHDPGRALRRRGRHRGDAARPAPPGLRAGPAGRARRPGDHDRDRLLREPRGERHDQRADGPARGGRRTAPGGARGAREPRAQPLHRGRGAPHREGRVPRLRAGRALLDRGLSGHRRGGTRDAILARPRPAHGGLLRRLRVPPRPRRQHGPGGLRRLLLRRRRVQRARGGLPRPRGLRAVLRPPAGGGGRACDRGAADDPLRRARRAHQRRAGTPTPRRCARTRRSSASTSIRTSITASTTTPRRATTPRPRPSPGSARMAFFDEFVRGGTG